VSWHGPFGDDDDDAGDPRPPMWPLAVVACAVMVAIVLACVGVPA